MSFTNKIKAMYSDIIEIKTKIREHIDKGIAPYRGLCGNGEMVTLTPKETKNVEKLLNECKSVKEIISDFHQNKL